MGKRKVDLFDMLPPEGISRVDEAGFAFLGEQGYGNGEVPKNKRERDAVFAAMRADGVRLLYNAMYDGEQRAALVFFTLKKRKTVLAKGGRVKFIFEAPPKREAST